MNEMKTKNKNKQEVMYGICDPKCNYALLFAGTAKEVAAYANVSVSTVKSSVSLANKWGFRSKYIKLEV